MHINVSGRADCDSGLPTSPIYMFACRCVWLVGLISRTGSSTSHPCNQSHIKTNSAEREREGERPALLCSSPLCPALINNECPSAEPTSPHTSFTATRWCLQTLKLLLCIIHSLICAARHRARVYSCTSTSFTGPGLQRLPAKL